MTTDRLYYIEPALLTFEATVTATDVVDGRHRCELDRSAFYPSSGGQPHDVGRLGERAVLDVVEDDEGRVWQVMDGPLAVGARVKGAVDGVRRRDHMQQHSGQHVLSAAFDRLADVRTESFHLGGEASTIDLAREVSAAEIQLALDAANRVIWEDRPVTIRFASSSEAAGLPLRKEPARGGRLRLIDIEGFDLSACGGTHVARTGEIGMIAIRRSERFKGGSRVEFVCGARTLRAFSEMRELLERACRPLSIGATDLPATIERLQTASKEQQRLLKALSARLAAFESRQLATRAEPCGAWLVAAEVFEGFEANDLKTVAAGFVCAPGRIAVLVGTGEPAPIVVARSADVAFDAGGLVKALTSRLGGRGGGRPELAQGGIGASAEAVVREARSILGEANS